MEKDQNTNYLMIREWEAASDRTGGVMSAKQLWAE